MSRRIAIVEDEPAIRGNYADVLRKQGYEVAAYGNRADALAAFRTRLPDLAIIDIGLARRDRRRLRAVPRAPRAVADGADHLPLRARF